MFGVLVAYMYMENISSSEYKATPEVKGQVAYLIKKLTNFKNLKFVNFMLDILEILASLSLAFQENSLTIGSKVIDAIELADFSWWSSRWGSQKI